MKTIGNAFLTGFIAAFTAVTASAQTNLLFNANGETGDMTGWNVEQNGGDGWYVGTGYAGPLPGAANTFATSYDWDVRSQTIDLLAAGYTADYLDSAPTVSIADWVNSFEVNGSFYVNVQLEDAEQNIIGSWNYGSQDDPYTSFASAGWTEITGDLENYGSGLRYIVFEDGGKDQADWAGNFGTEFDGSSVSFGVDAVPEPSTLALSVVGALSGLLLVRRRAN